jgi:Tfp pilus assembly major pilin PilA
MRAPLKILVVFLAVVSITTAITLISYASTETDEQVFDRIAESLQLNQEPTGVLWVLDGDVTVNLNLAKNGETIISDSIITTKANGKARIELDTLGRITVDNGTTIYLKFTLLPGKVYVRSNCTQTQIKVTRGQVEVRKESIPAGKSRVYEGDVEAMTNGDTDFEIGCHSGNGGLIPNTAGHGLWGLLALLGNSAGEVGPLIPVLSPLNP